MAQNIKLKIGFLGLGKMGQRIVSKLVLDGHEVVAWNRSHDVAEDFGKDFGQTGITIAKTIAELVLKLEPPKIFWLMLPAGEPTQFVIDSLKKYLKSGDIVIDGGNAFFRDSEKRSEELKDLGVKFLGIGVSGGVKGAENGFSLMAGGEKSAWQIIKPILKTLSLPFGSFDYFGEGGAGHFIKMVHNGIEYGMMQSIAEGFEVLEKSKYKFNFFKIAKVWQKGAIISSFLIDLIADQLEKDSNLSDFVGKVSENGEAEWTINEAKLENVEVSVIKKSLEFRLRSQKEKSLEKSFTARVLNALRFAFGGHKIKKHDFS